MSAAQSRTKTVVRMSAPLERKRGIPWAPLVLVLIVAGLALSLVNWEHSMDGAIYPGVRIAGVDVGGHSLAEARRQMLALNEATMNRTITVLAGSRQWTVTPRTLGLHLDVEQRLRDAYALGRESDAFTRYSTQIDLALHGRGLGLAGNYDANMLHTFVQQLAIGSYRSAQPAVVSLRHAQALLATHAVTGVKLDQATATGLLANALADPSTSTVRVPLVAIAPPVSEAEGQREVAALQSILGARLHLHGAGQSWTFAAAQIAPAISLTTVIAPGGAATYQHSLDPRALAHYIDTLATQIDRPVQEAAVAVHSAAISVIPAASGYHLDRFTTRQLLSQAILQGGEQDITLPVAIVAPAMPTLAAQQAARQAAELIRRPLSLTFGGHYWLLGPDQLGSLLTFSPRHDPNAAPALDMHVDPARLQTVLAPVAAAVDVQPVDARFVVQGASVHLVPSARGSRIDYATLASAIAERGRTVRLPVPMQGYDPRLTTAGAQAMGIHDLLISHTTTFPGSTEARLTNIHAAVQHLDGQLIAPGAVFSFNQRIGDITPAGGYVQGINIVDNQDVPGIGGGVCQVAVTLFQSAVFVGMPIVERVPHANVVSYYNPIGMDATVYVSPDGPDVKFQNNTGHWVLIGFVEDLAHDRLTANFFGTDPHFRVAIRGPFVTNQRNGNVDAVFYRTVYDSTGKVILDAHFNSHYVPVGA